MCLYAGYRQAIGHLRCKKQTSLGLSLLHTHNPTHSARLFFFFCKPKGMTTDDRGEGPVLYPKIKYTGKSKFPQTMNIATQ